MACFVAIMLMAAGGQAAPFEEVTLTGQAVLLTEALTSHDLSADPGPIADQVVLRTEDGTIVPLLSTPASRALFEDERLRERPIQVQGRRHPGLPYVQVTSMKVADQGQWLTPEYDCEICSISVRDPQVCPCCQGEMELRLRP